MNPKVDAYLNKASNWQPEMRKLRAIALDCGLKEELKWGKPCYAFQGRNVVLIVGFKQYCALLFCKGALLKDPDELLITPTENTQAARQIRFTHVREIGAIESKIKKYIKQAIQVEKAGLEVTFKDTADFKFPAEFQNELNENAALQAAFQKLTPGRQRGYILYFSGAKQSKTRSLRVQKCTPRILHGKGLND